MDIRHFNIKDIFKSKEDQFKWYFGLIYLLILVIPFNHKEAFSIYDPDLVWSKFVLIAIAALGCYFFIRNFKKYIKDPFFLFFIILVGFQVLSLLQTRDVVSSLRLIAFQTAIAFAYIPVRNFIFERKNGLSDLINLYGIIFIPVFVFLIVQIYLQNNYEVAIGGIWPVPGYPTRYGSTFWDINHFGAFCSALSLILIGILLKRGDTLKSKLFPTLILVFTLTSLYLTSSRSSMLGFAAGIAVLGVIYAINLKIKVGSKSQYSLYYFSAVGAVLGFLGVLYLLADSLKASLLYRSVSFFSHLFLLKVGIIIGIQNFMLGIGANSFHAYFRHTEWANVYYYIDRAALDLKLPLHNLWLEVLAETGLVSFIFFVSFWVLLLIGLYRVYKSQKDYIALGLISAITSFLVAGIMYSYKSEFFWMFVLISSAYVSKFYFNKANINLLTSIKNVVCPKNCDVGKILLMCLSLFSLLLPIIFMTHPMSRGEVNMFTRGFESNLISDQYTQLLILFKYIIGNYTYTGRALSLVFYFGSISLLFLVMKRYFGAFYSLVFTSLIISIANILEPNLIVSVKFYVAFIVLAAAGFFVLIATYLNRNSFVFKLPKVISKNILIAISSVIIILGLISNNIYFKNAYDVDLTFLLELAYNRRLMDKSLIQVSDDIDLQSVYYFSDEVQRTEKGFINVEGDVMPAQGVELTFYEKNLFIYTEASRGNINSMVSGLRESPLVDIIDLKQGNYNILLIEKKSAPLVQLQ